MRPGSNAPHMSGGRVDSEGNDEGGNGKNYVFCALNEQISHACTEEEHKGTCSKTQKA